MIFHSRELCWDAKRCEKPSRGTSQGFWGKMGQIGTRLQWETGLALLANICCHTARKKNIKAMGTETFVDMMGHQSGGRCPQAKPPPDQYSLSSSAKARADI